MKGMKRYKIKILISLTIIVLSIIVLIETFIIPNKNIYIYNTNQNVDYNVYIFPNDFLNTNVIPKDNVYIQAIINYINASFNYQYYASKKANLDYVYSLKSTLMIDYANTNQNIIKDEEYIIKDKTLTLNDSNKISISETLNLDYQKYRDEAAKFKEEFQISTKSYIKLNFDIKTGIKLNDKTEKTYDTSTQELVIDLSQPVFKIEENKSQNNQKYISEKIDYKNYIMYFVLIIIFATLIYLYRITRENKIIVYGKYKIVLNKILKKYADIIVELKEEIEVEVKHIIEVKDFNQLLDVEEEIREPILFYEKDNKEAVFFIIDDDIKYEFILKEEDDIN